MLPASIFFNSSLNGHILHSTSPFDDGWLGALKICWILSTLMNILKFSQEKTWTIITHRHIGSPCVAKIPLIFSIMAGAVDVFSLCKHPPQLKNMFPKNEQARQNLWLAVFSLDIFTLKSFRQPISSLNTESTYMRSSFNLKGASSPYKRNTVLQSNLSFFN